MSMLQRITRAITTTSRSFTTSRIALSTESSATTSSNKPTGLYQFFENNEALPKQNWTGKISKHRVITESLTCSL
jgi:large subunit ribosomal protein L47